MLTAHVLNKNKTKYLNLIHYLIRDGGNRRRLRHFSFAKLLFAAALAFPIRT